MSFCNYYNYHNNNYFYYYNYHNNNYCYYYKGRLHDLEAEVNRSEKVKQDSLNEVIIIIIIIKIITIIIFVVLVKKEIRVRD